MIKDDLVFESLPEGKVYPIDTPLDEIINETGAKWILRMVVNAADFSQESK